MQVEMQPRVIPWSKQEGAVRATWPDGESPMTHNVSYEYMFKCFSCGDFFSEHADGVRMNESGYLQCAVCGKRAIEEYEARMAGAATGPIHIDVPPEYTTADLSIFQSKHGSILKAWPVQRPLLGITGIPGSGKTTAIYSVAKNLASQGRRAYVMICGDERRRWYTAMPGKREQIVQAWTQARWLLIDDLSSPPASDGWASAMHDLINTRMVNRLPTMITSAAKGDEIEEKYGAAIRSRLGAWNWIVLPPKDWRKPLFDAAAERPDSTVMKAKDLFGQNEKAAPSAAEIKNQPNVGGSSK